MKPSLWVEKILGLGRAMIPKSVFRLGQPIYHYATALLAALWYRFPGRSIRVVMITGTKGKTSTAEIINAILNEAGYKTALSSTIRINIADQASPNLYKMTTPGRFFLQKLLREAVGRKCDWAVIEMTSEGARQFRHKFIELDAFIFTNIAPEHLESHGSYEAYREAKLSIARELARSPKPNRTLIVNGDDKEAAKFLALDIPTKITYSLKQLEPIQITNRGTEFTFEGVRMLTKLPGQFNLYNLLGGVRGRMEPVGWQDFQVIVDYAHTPDSLRQVYATFPHQRKIAVLGGAGGGRDKWKRPVIGKIADESCDLIILTDEDPYDENPEQIVEEIAVGMKNHRPKIIMDRRLAIREALRQARAGDVVVITGKGTDPYIMGPKGTKTPWDDRDVAREELEKILLK